MLINGELKGEFILHTEMSSFDGKNVIKELIEISCDDSNERMVKPEN
jgi:hypothetical protein